MVRNAIEMQGWHALALLVCGLWVPRVGRIADWAGAAFTVGIVLFCGAVYTLALAAIQMGVVVPIGGTLLILGWLLLGISALAACSNT